MKTYIKIIIFYFLIILSACSTPSESGDGNSAQGKWLIPRDEVYDGGPGQDGIPALVNPGFEHAQSVDYLKNDDLVIGIKIGDETRAYPHIILDWHEIINDEINGSKFAITYCPLTGSGIGWNRIINGNETTFGVSGLLYNSNLIPYDRATGSRWSQMLMKAVNGSLMGTDIKTVPVIETTWQTWKMMYPNSKVVSKLTGFSRSYGVYPYGDYKTNNNNFLFPYSPKDSRLPSKERVFGILIDSKAVAFTFNFFSTINIFNTTVNDVPVVVYGNKNLNLAFAYERKNNGKLLEFNLANSSPSAIMQDNFGNIWNVFGEAIEGPDKGAKLKPVISFISYWFAWAAFYPGTELRN